MMTIYHITKHIIIIYMTTIYTKGKWYMLSFINRLGNSLVIYFTFDSNCKLILSSET